jgi:hypothetical protein
MYQPDGTDPKGVVKPGLCTRVYLGLSLELHLDESS